VETTNANPLRRGIAVALLFAFLLVPSPALAGAQTLKRGLGNIIQAPIDIVLAPITVGIVEYRSLTNVEDTTGVRVAYAVPGYLWLLGLTWGASMLRCFAGFLEFLPGLFLVFTDAELDPMFAPSERGEGVIWDYPSTVMDFKLGLDYTSTPF
jgi:hypothetical protein